MKQYKCFDCGYLWEYTCNEYDCPECWSDNIAPVKIEDQERKGETS